MSSRYALLLAAALGVGCLAQGALADGQAKAQACAACHGADGNSVNPIWPSLAGQNAGYIVDQLKAFKSGQRENPSMSPMAATLEEGDMQEIAAFYMSQAPRIAALPADAARAGETLYRGGDAERGIPACMACHGPSGVGNAAANYPALRGQHPEYTALQLKAYRDGTRTTGPQQMMQMIAAKLDDADIEGLARYLSALH